MESELSLQEIACYGDIAADVKKMGAVLSKKYRAELVMNKELYAQRLENGQEMHGSPYLEVSLDRARRAGINLDFDKVIEIIDKEVALVESRKE